VQPDAIGWEGPFDTPNGSPAPWGAQKVGQPYWNYQYDTQKECGNSPTQKTIDKWDYKPPAKQ
jgi:hypothetical protein